MNIALADFLCLFGRKNYIFVVGEYENIVCGNLIARVGDILGARVHGLTALDDFVYKQILEYGRHTVARTYGNHAVRFEFLGFPVRKQRAVLLEHVLYFDSVDFAQFERIRKRLTGIVRMDVNLDHGQVADDKHAIADRHQLIAEIVDIRLFRRGFEIDDEKLGAVCKFYGVELCQIDMELFVIVGLSFGNFFDAVVEFEVDLFLSHKAVIKALEHD